MLCRAIKCVHYTLVNGHFAINCPYYYPCLETVLLGNTQVKSISRASAGRSSELENVDPDAKIKEKVTDADDQLTRDADVLQKVMSGSSHCKGKDLMGMITRVIAVPNLTKSDLKESNLKSEVGQVS